jgi:hypothetical protein
MARDGLFPLLCAGLLLGALGPCATADDSPTEYARGLAVQVALHQGREYMRAGNYELAVKVLESQIAYINGSGEYLSALRDAYRGAIKNLRLVNRPTESALAEVYARRLAILEKSAPLDNEEKTLVRPAAAPPPAPLASSAPPLKVRAKIDTPTREAPALGESVRDPFDTSNQRRLGEARELLDRANAEFRSEHYEKAGELYALAHQAVPDVTREVSERWAYCRLHAVVLRLNQRKRPPSNGDLDALEQEVRTAAGMTPKLKGFGDKLLATIQARRTSDASSATPAPVQATEPPAIEVRHGQAPGTGWAVAETTNFRIFHNQEQKYAEMVARVAETTRAAMQRKWFGQAGEDWNPRCDIYLYPSAEAYNKEAPQARPNTPANTTVARKGSTILSRRIDLHVDDPNLLSNILPHETTHAVLAGRFGPFDLPRWADEGIAVLSESPESPARWLRIAPQFRQAGQTFSAQQLMQLRSESRSDWPEASLISAFYAHSVALVDFLCKQKGPQVFAQFLGDSLRTGEEAALKKHYGLQGFQDLDARWRAEVFGETGSGYAQR